MLERPALLIPRGARQQWACPCCKRTLGEVYGTKVVIKAGERQITYPKGLPVSQTCPQCATVSTIPPELDAA